MDNIDNIARFREPFWVQSTPETTRPDWHEGDCYMKIEWDFTVQRPKKTCYGTTGYARLGRVILGGEDAEPGAIFRFHICADTPCKAQWELSKYGAGKEAPLHVVLAPAAADEPAVAGEHAAAAVYGEPVRAPEPSAEPLEPLEPPDDPPEPPVAPVDEEEATIVHPVALAPAVAPPTCRPCRTCTAISAVMRAVIAATSEA